MTRRTRGRWLDLADRSVFSQHVFRINRCFAGTHLLLFDSDWRPKDMSTGTDQSNVGRQDHRRGLIVGLGASAGGLEAFKRFFRAMPADSGMIFVLAQHLDPSQKSLVAELLNSQTNMPVVEGVDGVEIEPNHVILFHPTPTWKWIMGGFGSPSRSTDTAGGWPSTNSSSLCPEAKPYLPVGVIFSGYGKRRHKRPSSDPGRWGTDHRPGAKDRRALRNAPAPSTPAWLPGPRHRGHAQGFTQLRRQSVHPRSGGSRLPPSRGETAWRRLPSC